MIVLTGLEESLIQLIQNWYLATGYLGIVLAMTLESCGIPLPSEIVMPLAGYFVFAHPDQFSLVGVALAGAVGCVIGSTIAYWIGATGGRPLLLKYGRYILISKADADAIAKKLTEAPPPGQVKLSDLSKSLEPYEKSADYNFLAAIGEYASWGYFDPYADGFQSPPVTLMAWPVM